jgi:hypothetical protein
MISQPAAEGTDEAMNPRLEAVYHDGTCLQRGGEGDALATSDNPFDLACAAPEHSV